MAARKWSHVWIYFSSSNSQDAVCDVCGKTVRSCVNTTNLVKHLRLNHNTEYSAFMMSPTEEESTVSGVAAGAGQTSLAESLGAAGRHCPGTEEE